MSAEQYDIEVEITTEGDDVALEAARMILNEHLADRVRVWKYDRENGARVLVGEFEA